MFRPRSYSYRNDERGILLPGFIVRHIGRVQATSSFHRLLVFRHCNTAISDLNRAPGVRVPCREQIDRAHPPHAGRAEGIRPQRRAGFGRAPTRQRAHRP